MNNKQETGGEAIKVEKSFIVHTHGHNPLDFPHCSGLAEI